MSNLVATATEETWDHEKLMLNTICSFCNREHLNKWFSCNRRASMVNLHPGLLSLSRQHYYLIKIVAKYAMNDYGIRMSFAGHPGATTTKHTFTIPHVSLPKHLQQHQYITHGELFLQYYMI